MDIIRIMATVINIMACTSATTEIGSTIRLLYLL
jgi:hypothetical protein